MLLRNRVFKANRRRAEKLNRQRIDQAHALDLPELEFLELTVLVDEKTANGFRGDPGVSYLVTTDLGSLLFDVGFGPDSPTFSHNAIKLGVDFSAVDAVVISHLHPDHMGGMAAFRSKSVRIPKELDRLSGKPCFLPDAAEAGAFDAEVIKEPRVLRAGIGTTGPLARSLFFLGLCEEQATVARIRDRGLVVITGCGHPTVEVILEIVRRLSDEPIYAIAGGIHFPITKSRSQRRGVQVQMFFGTGKPPWQRITNGDLSRTIACINQAGPKKVLLSAHDTCDHALDRLGRELNSETVVLQAGRTYRL
ncbi:MAG: MBL fold metallo-hydrolase [Planctomycetes bacterium]|nr:MBL fold metallo-hydrolase [Planctomycetota bacterium]